MDNNERSLMKIFNEDDIIIKEGEMCSAMYKILSGKVALYLNYGEETEYLIGVAGEQKCFGDVSLLSGKPSPYTVVALSTVMAMQITEEQLESFIIKNTRNAMDIMNNMARSIVMLSTNLNMITEEFSDVLSQLKELQQSEKNQLQLHDVSKKINEYKMSALTGGSYYI